MLLYDAMHAPRIRDCQSEQQPHLRLLVHSIPWPTSACLVQQQKCIALTAAAVITADPAKASCALIHSATTEPVDPLRAKAAAAAASRCLATVH